MRKVVIITGATGGIGLELANKLAECGYTVVATDIMEHKFVNDNIHFYRADLRKYEDIAVLFAEVKKKFGHVHALINNGAIGQRARDVRDLTIEEFDSVISINLRGSFICCKEFMKVNEGEDYGRIINIASTRFHQNEAGWDSYGASKGGIVALTNSLCISLSDTPITVNAISPGWIETGDYSKLTKQDHSQHPSRRVGKPDDIARACVFLLEPSNDFINGNNLIIDGGMTKKMIYI